MIKRQIFDSAPQSWKDLQNYVAQVFSEIGCIVHVAKTKKLPRGAIELTL